MILVVGANGFLGYEICRQLTKREHKVRIMIRETLNPVNRKRLADIGVQVVFGDLRDVTTFPEAFADVTVVISTVSSIPNSYIPGQNDIRKVDLDGIKNLIDFAKAFGVKRFIYTSFSKNIIGDFPLRIAKRSVESYLRSIGMVYTILRPSFFMETWLTSMVGFDVDNASVQIFGNGINPVSYISYRDVALFAVESINNMHARNAIIELGGPHKLSQISVVKIFEEIARRTFEKQIVSKALLQNQMKEAKDAMERSFSGLKLCVANGDSIEMVDTLEKFPVNLTSVRDYARQCMLVH